MNALRGVRSAYASCRAFVQKRPAVKYTLSVLVWLPLASAVIEYGLSVKTVRGRSMQPTLNPDDSPWKDIVLFDTFAIKFRHDYKRGDVVALKSPVDSKLIVKRIIALEGDTVKTLPPYPDAEVCIPPGHAWVEGVFPVLPCDPRTGNLTLPEGDEPFRTEDSNRFGPVPLGLVQSRLAYILWPWNRIGPLGKPLVPRHDAVFGSPDWRRSKSELEREKWRQSRVTIAGSAAATAPHSPEA
ncbi:LexA/Signal peptidase [Cubamyces lactineus]|nr:LexA/Signal peptidase [Cubamyces lactineus]